MDDRLKKEIVHNAIAEIALFIALYEDGVRDERYYQKQVKVFRRVIKNLRSLQTHYIYKEVEGLS